MLRVLIQINPDNSSHEWRFDDAGEISKFAINLPTAHVQIAIVAFCETTVWNTLPINKRGPLSNERCEM